MDPSRFIAGIFVGGRSRRMNGIPKGLLQQSGQSLTLVEVLLGRLKNAGVGQVVLVGHHDAYLGLSIPTIRDSVNGEGPLSGLLALGEYAEEQRYDFVLALACDMPYIDDSLINHLIYDAEGATVLVPKRTFFEPLCARYHVNGILPHLYRQLSNRHYRMTSLLEALGDKCATLSLLPTQLDSLDDWDCPRDVPKGVTYDGIPIERVIETGLPSETLE
jgi:molybdopterin-guanine dinucleotide biosynthesis protein A